MRDRKSVNQIAIASRSSQTDRHTTEDKLLLFSTLIILVLAIVTAVEPKTIGEELETTANNAIAQARSEFFGDRY